MSQTPTIGDDAPTFSVTQADGDVSAFYLDDVIGHGPVVLAFFPGAFTPPCTNEMVALQEHSEEFEAAGASVYGVSADSAFSQNAFREEHGIEFPLLSDMARSAIDKYGVEIDIDDLGLFGVANRSVFIIDDDGTIAYDWVAEDPTNEPDYEELLSEVQDL
ncbi:MULTISPECIES: redoxin domain-containing protein [Halobellus]|uniref:redoxin domain-containing protein n=1 Tax=Halobellus TaxID=1073986 RepID=UPI00210D49F1|nr:MULTISPECIES: redoxin domain-containing protein [Halobellus]MDQ2055086.1 redoxin domain-containing protein [Halobellus sp. H-GB7]